MIPLILSVCLTTCAVAHHKPSHDFKHDWPPKHSPVIPEPSTAGFLALGLSLLLIRRR